MKNKPIQRLICLLAMASLCAGNLLAQDEPGGPPPDEPGDIVPDPINTAAGPNGFAPNGGPPRDFDPAKFQQRFMEQARQSLGVTNDEEWAAIQPLVQKVMEARREANMGGMRPPGMGGPPGGQGGHGPFGGEPSAEQQDLQKAVADGVPNSQIKDALAKYRAARKDKQSKLEAAQGDLKKVLSVKQEAQAVLLGLLQ